MATVRSLRGRSLDGFDIGAGAGSLSIGDGATGDHRRSRPVRFAADVPHGATVVLEVETADADRDRPRRRAALSDGVG